MPISLVSLVTFVLAYFFFILFPAKRWFTAILASFVLLIAGVISLGDAVKAVNWNVMGVFVGMLFVADAFMESRVPAYLAEIIVNRSKRTSWAILFMCLLSGFISAFVENVATVLIVAPIAISLARKLKISPVGILIAIAVSSNLQGAATLIGDPPSMLLAGYAKMSFLDFFFYQGRPSIFFAVELGALASLLVLYLVFWKNNQKVKLIREEKVKSWVPTIFLVILIFLLALSSFFDPEFSYLSGVICFIAGIICLVWEAKVFNKSLENILGDFDWRTTLFLIGVFILVGSMGLTGWIDKISSFLSSAVGDNIFFGFTLLVLVSVFVSAFVDNVPFLAAMLPVAMSMSERLYINPALFMFGLLIGASLGGNITPLGASANIVACGLLKKEGYDVTFKDFLKIGLPFTVVAVAAAYIFIWFVWS